MNFNNNHPSPEARKVAALISSFLFTVVILQLITIFKIDYLDITMNEKINSGSLTSNIQDDINHETTIDIP